MAHPDGTSARAHRLIGLVASLLLAATTALAFGRVFLGGGATLELLAVALASAGLAVLFERRSLLLATLVSAAGLAIAVGLTVFPGTTWYGIPTADTLGAALDAAGAVGEQARLQVAPATPIAPLMLAAVVSLWAAVFSSHALAFRAGSPLLGLIPPVALVAFADTVLEQFVKPLYGWAFLVAAIVVVFADGLARVQGWGPIWSSSRTGVAAVAGQGARRLAGTVLAVALIAPIVVPGFGSRAVIDFGATSEDRVTIDPIVAVTNRLQQRTPVKMLAYTSPRPTYLRLVALPNFDGQRWGPDPAEQTGAPVGPDGIVESESPLVGGVEPVDVEVLTDLGMPWVPTVYPVESIRATGSSVTYDAATGTTFADPPLREGDTYALSAMFETPAADELRAVRDKAGFGRPLEEDTVLLDGTQRYLTVPSGLPGEIEQIAREWTEGETTVFDRAMAIQARLQEFEYDADTAIVDDTGAMVTFLTETQAGFCQQFAATMGVMLRTLDIPTRLVVGFGTAGPARDGPYEVRSDRAHVWVEVFFRGYGWMPFEPTPNRENPAVEAYRTQVTGGAPDGDAPRDPAGTSESGRVASQGDLRPVPPVTRGGGREAGAGAAGLPREPEGISARVALLIAATLAGIGFLLIPVARSVRRRIALGRAAGEPRRSILVTYGQFTDRAAGVGLPRARGETFDEYRRKVLDTGYLSDGEMDRLTSIATAAAYSPREPDAEDVRSANEAADTALSEIRRAVGPRRWFVGLYRREA
jgi:transglutaminase-like putative cysteine protease